MSETLVAALIAAAATVSASLLQLKVAFSKEIAARTGGGSRRKSRVPVVLIVVLLVASAAGGYSLAQWLNEDERLEQNELRRELEMRIGELGRAAAQLEETRGAARADIERGILQRLGEQGAVAQASVGPCKPATVAGGVSTVAPQAQASCTETEATPISLCATVPLEAQVTSVELFSRPTDATGDWSASRAGAGQEVERARFSDGPVETADGAGAKQVCHMFVNWGGDRGRSARMLVRYQLPPS